MDPVDSRGAVGSPIGVVSLINGSVPVESGPVIAAASSSPSGVCGSVDFCCSLFRLPSVENLLRGSKRRRNPVRGAERPSEVEGRDWEEPMIDR